MIGSKSPPCTGVVYMCTPPQFSTPLLSGSLVNAIHA